MGERATAPRRFPGLTAKAIPLLAVAAGIFLTAWVWQREDDSARRVADLEFDREVHQVERAIVERLHLTGTVLRAAQGFLSGSDHVTISDWRRFAGPLDLTRRFPGLDGLVYYTRVRPGETAAFEAVQRTLWGPSFTIRSAGRGKLPPGHEHLVVTLAEPAPKVETVIGLDVAGEPIRRATARRAADTGEPVLSAVLHLLTDGGTDRDMIHMAPVYAPGMPLDTVEERRQALSGIVALGYNMHATLAHVLEPFVGTLAIRVEDSPWDPAPHGPPQVPPQILYTVGDLGPDAAALRRTLTLEVDGRRWTVEVRQVAGTLAPPLPLGLPLAGLFLSGLLGLTLWLLMTRRAKAEALAGQMTLALARSQERYRQLFVRNRAVELLINPGDGAIVDANEAAERFYGWDAATLRTMRMTDINILPAEQVRAEMASALRYGRDHFFFRHRLASGEVRDVEVRTGPIDDQDRQLLYSIVHDVTERKIAEQALVDTLQELERSNAELEQFAYIASHDLQEPLRMVTSYLGLIRRRYDDRLDDDGREFIGYAVDGAHRMQTLISDLLIYSRVGRLGKPFAPVDLGKVVDAVAVTLRLVLNESGGALTCGPLPTVLGDEQELLRVFQNLIGNALKYRDPDRPPRISVHGRRDGTMWRIEVTDNGIGIPAEFTDRIFLIFQRLHNRAEYSGTGIGLAICKKVVERHQGSIGVLSLPGEGSVFWFTVPVMEASCLQDNGAPGTSDAYAS